MRVLVTSPIPERGLELLQGCHDVTVINTLMDDSCLAEHIRDKEAVLCLLRDNIDSSLMDSAPSLRLIANLAVGFDNIDVAAATERGILVTNTPDVLTDASADMTWALILSAARRVVEGDSLMRSGSFTGWDPMLLRGKELRGCRLGIVGMGRIGSAVARRARGFDMEVIYHNRTRAPNEGEVGARMTSLDELLTVSDIVSLHVPGTVDTHHLIDARALDLMRDDAILINMSRGNVVDEEALVRALNDHRIMAAGLDVFEREPAIHPGLLGLSNVVLTPHLGSATFDTRERMALMAAGSIIDALNGNLPRNSVNPDAWRKNL